jgi:hypothetical protein
MVSSMAARKSSALPMSLIAMTGEAGRVSVLDVM